MKSKALLVGIGVLCMTSMWTIWNVRVIRAARAEMSATTDELTRLQSLSDEMSQKAATARVLLTALEDEIAGMVGKQAVPSWKSVPLGEARWGTSDSFVDVPKSVLKRIHVEGLSFAGQAAQGRIPGRNPFEANVSDARVTSEAADLLGFTEPERSALANLYIEMNKRFEQLEVTHLARTNQQAPRAVDLAGDKVSFVIPAFPDEMAALKREWITNMENTVGESRAAFFAEYAANRAAAPRSSGAASSLSLMQRPSSDWLLGGMKETVITVVFTPGQTNFTYYQIGGLSGSGGINRWPHLLTPEVLSARK